MAISKTNCIRTVQDGCAFLLITPLVNQMDLPIVQSMCSPHAAYVINAEVLFRIFRLLRTYAWSNLEQTPWRCDTDYGAVKLLVDSLCHKLGNAAWLIWIELIRNFRSFARTLLIFLPSAVPGLMNSGMCSAQFDAESSVLDHAELILPIGKIIFIPACHVVGERAIKRLYMPAGISDSCNCDQLIKIHV